MLIKKTASPLTIVRGTAHHIVWILVMTTIITLLYSYGYIDFTIPWLPISVIATAVAFYVGFKNNQAYDRMWEARKNWGAIVNDSRTWGIMVDGFVTNKNTKINVSDDKLKVIKRKLIYRHIAWLYAHRHRLLCAESWEHISQSGAVGRKAAQYQKKAGVGLISDDVSQIKYENLLNNDEYNRLRGLQNATIQIINEQSKNLTALCEAGIIDDFRHVEMMGVLRSFYEYQGKNERIKTFPLPRQYANMSRYFVGIFITLLQFSMIPELLKVEHYGFILAILITSLIEWVYVMMEIVGDYSENPFQGMSHDIPMLSLCRTAEIDLRQMLGETDLPQAIKAKNNVLM